MRSGRTVWRSITPKSPPRPKSSPKAALPALQSEAVSEVAETTDAEPAGPPDREQQVAAPSDLESAGNDS